MSRELLFITKITQFLQDYVSKRALKIQNVEI